MRITGLHVYPVKGCAVTPLERAGVEPLGLRHDRRWLIVDLAGRFITQREVPAMARLRPAVTDSGLRLQMDSLPPLDVVRPAAGAPTMAVQVWRSTVTVPAADPAAEAWVSQALDRPCRLVYMPPDCVRAVNPDFSRPGDRVSFADGYPLLLTNEASLAALNARLPEPVPMDRFRPSVVIAGAAPFAEELWRFVRLGEALFEVAKACERCVVITTDQTTGERQGAEPLRTLAELHGPGRPVTFGVNLIPRRYGVLAVGDAVETLTGIEP